MGESNHIYVGYIVSYNERRVGLVDNLVSIGEEFLSIDGRMRPERVIDMDGVFEFLDTSCR